MAMKVLVKYRTKKFEGPEEIQGFFLCKKGCVAATFLLILPVN
jgi:hypothetical protein